MFKSLHFPILAYAANFEEIFTETHDNHSVEYKNKITDIDNIVNSSQNRPVKENINEQINVSYPTGTR